MTSCLSLRRAAFLAIVFLAGCTDSPTAADDEVEVIVTSDRHETSWYDVTVRSGPEVRLHENITLANARAEVGAVAPGTYDILVVAEGGQRDSRTVDLVSRNVVYVTHKEGQPVRIVIEALGD